MPSPGPPSLVRAIGRWSLAALAINLILGSAVFGLPSLVAALLGGMSPLAVPLAGLGMAVILACYAELASRFVDTGGHYLYCREAFGPFAGIQVGWFTLLVRVAATAANANLFVIYLAEFWPGAVHSVPRLVVITSLVAGFALVNILGVQAGTRVNNLLVIAKLLPLILLCATGAVYLLANHRVALAGEEVHAGAGAWLQAMMLLVFAYGGAEMALTPVGEVREPRRDTAFALAVALGAVIVIYTLVQWIVIALLPDAAHSARPLADAARVMMGSAGAVIIAVGALISVFGCIGANMLTGPRVSFALAEQGDFPDLLGAVHPRWRTPYASIAFFAIAFWLLACVGSFAWNVTLSVVARLAYYALTCAAVPVLRRRHPEGDALRLPGGVLLPSLGILICVALATRVDFSQSLILAAVFLVAGVNWLLVRRRATVSPAAASLVHPSGRD
jgi:APA family basic amino acid/polyamine antiporter